MWAYNPTLAHHSNPVRNVVSRDGTAARFQQLGTLFCSVYFWQKMHESEGRSCQTGASLRYGWEPRPHAPVSKTAACMAASGGAILSPSLKGSSWTLPCVGYLCVAVEDKDVSCAVVFQVGDLQAAGVADLSRLEGGIEGLNFHHCFGVSSLHREWAISLLKYSIFSNIFNLSYIIWLTSCLLKYFSAPSLSDRMNFRLKNWPLSRPRFHRNPSLYPGWKTKGAKWACLCVCACVWLEGAIKASSDKARN